MQTRTLDRHFDLLTDPILSKAQHIATSIRNQVRNPALRPSSKTTSRHSMNLLYFNILTNGLKSLYRCLATDFRILRVRIKLECGYHL